MVVFLFGPLLPAGRCGGGQERHQKEAQEGQGDERDDAEVVVFFVAARFVMVVVPVAVLGTARRTTTAVRSTRLALDPVILPHDGHQRRDEAEHPLEVVLRWRHVVFTSSGHLMLRVQQDDSRQDGDKDR